MSPENKVDTAALLATVDIVQVIDGYVPLIKNGAEYEACCPFHSEATPSFKVSPAKQFYHCFGCGANGDAIKFLREHRGLSFKDAVAELGGDVVASNAPARPAAPAREKKRTAWVPVLPVPDTAPEPHKAHVARGLPEAVWHYRDAQGRVLGLIFRFKTSDGGKEVLPLVWARHEETGAQEWRWLSFPTPRPLYGLDRLAARPEATVLLVEGEKCADAAQRELPELVVVSWPGGGKADGKADFSPLAGRKVITWADCDAKHVPLMPEEKAQGIEQTSKPLLPEAEQPGVATMARIRERLAKLECKLWNVGIPTPGEKPDGWDVADAIAEGLTGEALANYIRAQSRPAAVAQQGGEAGFVDSPESIYTPSGATAEDEDDGPPGARWQRQLYRKDGKLVDCRENVYLTLKHHPSWDGVLWANTFARRIVLRKPPPWGEIDFEPGRAWTDKDTLRLGLWMMQAMRLLIRSVENLDAAVSWVAAESPWNPVQDYLDGLHWDGQPRLMSWLNAYLGVRGTEYADKVGTMWLIGMVARIYEPGCQLRSMPILEGGQFKGKSTALRILGGEWFSDTPLDLNNKDVYQLIQGVWLYEIAELDAFNKAESTRIKAFISSMTDRFRAPYARSPEDHLRQGVFAGSTNQDEYFKDQTGNTRYWPIKVEEAGQINHEGLRSVRDQLFAEAVARYRQGERWHPNRDEQQRLFEPEQVEREIADPWEDIIFRWLDAANTSKVTTTDLLHDCLKVEAGKIDGSRSMSTRIGNVMKRLGWHKRREPSGKRGWYYARPAGEQGVDGHPVMEADDEQF